MRSRRSGPRSVVASPAAGAHPERLLADSNLDWGQDYLRLAETAPRRHIDRLRILFAGTILLQNHLPPAVGHRLTPEERGPGWCALSEGALASDPAARAGAYDWLKDYACTRVGQAIRLYRVPR